MIIDEIQCIAAETFVNVFDMIKAHSKLGLTATLVREDDKIYNLNYLIGPRLYEANWIDLAEQHFIARVKCYEVWCKMAPEFYIEYLKTQSPYQKRIYTSFNPNKFMTVERLIHYHEKRGDKILIFADLIYVIKKYHKYLETSSIDPTIHYPILTSDTKTTEVKKALYAFKPRVNTIVFLFRELVIKPLIFPQLMCLFKFVHILVLLCKKPNV